MLVLRLRDLERIAWREGRAAARELENRCVESFVASAARTLRAEDVIAHDVQSGDFIAALTSPSREHGAVATAADYRATLARLAVAMEACGAMQLESGWGILRGSVNAKRLAGAIETALDLGREEKERYEFFAAIGHELRTPLTSILGYLETVIEDDLDAKTVGQFLRVARAEAIRLGRLVDGMFDISVMDLRESSDRRDSCLMNAVTLAALEALAPLAVSRGATVDFVPTVEVALAVGADRFMQIVINLVENAIKHGNVGGAIRVTAAGAGARYVELCVDDDGPGVSALERESIFRLGSRGSGAQAKGSGIGLAIVRILVERTAGELDVVPSDRGGARFRVRLPRAS